MRAGDILVGKVTPKGESAADPGREAAARDLRREGVRREGQLAARAAGHGRHRHRRAGLHPRRHREGQARASQIEEYEIKRVKKDFDDQFRILESAIYARLRGQLLGKVANGGPGLKKGDTVSSLVLDGLKRSDWFQLRMKDDDAVEAIERAQKQIEIHEKEFEKRFQDKRAKITQGDDLAPGVLKMVKVYLAVKRRIQPGDKMAGRHGNKGVVSTIVPVRGHAVHGRRPDRRHRAEPAGRAEPNEHRPDPRSAPGLGREGPGPEDPAHAARHRPRSPSCASSSTRSTTTTARLQEERVDLKQFSDEELLALAQNLTDGVPMATPVFDGAAESEIKQMLALADLPLSGQTMLHDGRTGEAFERQVTVGYMHMLKLNHLVDDKMHARSTGPYSLVTQQPLGGKAQFGGQRFGEMEVWALEAYGAAYTLQEMLTVKSDDVQGRNQMYKNIVDGEHEMVAGMPESFNVLVKEIRSLAINMELEEH